MRVSGYGLNFRGMDEEDRMGFRVIGGRIVLGCWLRVGWIRKGS